MELADYTEDILGGSFAPDPDTVKYSGGPPEGLSMMNITMAQLNRRKDIKKVLMSELEEAFVTWKEVCPDGKRKEPKDFKDQQLLNAINSDPHLQATIMECLVEMTDCMDREGEPVYRPSAIDEEHLVPGVEYREDHDEIPAKYSGLSEAALDKLYSNPTARIMVSRMPAERITDELVDRLTAT